MIEKLKITFFGDKLGCAAQFEPNGTGLAIGQWGEDAEGRTTLTLTRDFSGGLAVPEGVVLVPRTLLEEVELSLHHAKTFIASRERMHADGIALHHECEAKIAAMLAAASQKQDNPA